MCSRYNLVSPPDVLAKYFGLDEIEEFPPRYNIAPTQPVGIVRNGMSGKPEFALVRWGLIPSWVKDPRQFSLLVNARAESASEKASFRGALRHRRCIVPADGFYEWTGKARARVPHLIRSRDGGLMAFAGLWEHWLGADGSEIETMAILTVAANRTIAPIHDRMPVLLPRDAFAPWLDCTGGRSDLAISLLAPAPDDLLEIVEIGPQVNNPRNEGAGLIEPVRRTLL